MATLVEGTTTIFTAGRHKIDPGKSWTDKSKGTPAYWSGSWGYYACAPEKGAKPLYWRGNDWQAEIHPTKNFDYDNQPDGMITVGQQDEVEDTKRRSHDQLHHRMTCGAGASGIPAPPPPAILRMKWCT